MQTNQQNPWASGTKIRMPILLIEEVTFPGSRIDLQLSNREILNDCKTAMEQNLPVFLTYQHPTEDAVSTSEKQIEQTGIVAQVKNLIQTDSAETGVILYGTGRGFLTEESFSDNNGHTSGLIEILPEEDPAIDADLQTEALCKTLTQTFRKYAEMTEHFNKTIASFIQAAKTIGKLTDRMAQYCPFRNDIKQGLLQILDPVERAQQLTQTLLKDIDIIKIEYEINKKIAMRTQETIREKYLRDQLDVIREELGDSPDSDPEILDFRKKIEESKMPEEGKKVMQTELDRFSKMGPYSSEAAIIRSYMQACLELPWSQYSTDKTDLAEARKLLDKEHYGLEKIKQSILRFLAVRILNPDTKGSILCLVGPPGTGKTSVSASIAKAMGRKFERLSLGGVYDESEIRGHRRTYLGSMPGVIMDAVKRAGTSNPVILLDEIDKLGHDYKGDPASALLEVLDPEQNKAFKDHYIDMPFDLSKVIFITTANYEENIPAPLRDRMDIVRLSSYTYDEKLHIAKKYLIPKQLTQCGLKTNQLKIADDALKKIITEYTNEGGVRRLEREIKNICSQVAVQIVEQQAQLPIQIHAQNLNNFLGASKIPPEKIPNKDLIGVVTGLAYTETGGAILPIEVNVMDGTGKTEITGSVGDVMKESAKAAVSYIRANAKQLGVSETFYKDKDIHIHVPDGATPKDGPSAGCAMATAVLSRLSGKKVRRDVAMTGEISITGKVLPIGGLKEKTLAAYKAGVKTIIIPKTNLPNMEDVAEIVKKKVTFYYAEEIGQVFDIAFVPDSHSVSKKTLRPKQNHSRKKERIEL